MHIFIYSVLVSLTCNWSGNIFKNCLEMSSWKLVSRLFGITHESDSRFERNGVCFLFIAASFWNGNISCDSLGALFSWLWVL